MNLVEKLVRERRARLAAEQLLAQKETELSAANLRLSRQAQTLAAELAAERSGLERARSEASLLKSQNSHTLGALEQANQAARQARRRLWLAMDTIRDGFAVFDRNLRLVIANRAYLSVFQGLGDVRPGIAYGDLVDLLVAGGRLTLKDGDPAGFRDSMIRRLDAPSIEPCLIELAPGTHIRLIDRWSDEGDLVCLALDITETIRREVELDEARRTAEAANRAKSAFLANMSHELRTPMNGVVGMADLLCTTTLTDDQRVCAETIRTSGEALLAIINDILDYSKTEAVQMRLAPEPFDLERCLHEVVMLLQPGARGRGLKLVVDFDMFLPTRFIGDPGRIRQILTNLLGNAVKFTSQGHVLARVVGVELPSGQYDLHVTVEDTGIGIAPEHLESIFGEFMQVQHDRTRSFEGTGLGLAITRQLVGLMGGSLWVDSAPGEGSCFGFRLTLPADEPQHKERPLRPVLLRRALILDGQVMERMILERQLATWGIAADAGLPETPLSDTPWEVVFAARDPAGDGPVLPPALAGLPVIDLLSEGQSPAPGRRHLTRPVLRGQLFAILQDLSYSGPAGAILPAAQPPADAPGPRPMRILAAEDNRTNQLVLRKMLQDLPVELFFAGDGQQALALWHETAPDLIFMDVSMPVMDGCEATRLIRAAEARSGRPRVPIVALTAHAMTGDDEPMRAAGCDHYLTKPLRKADLLDQLVRARPAVALPLPAPALHPPASAPPLALPPAAVPAPPPSGGAGAPPP